jgi:hypothetical protein
VRPYLKKNSSKETGAGGVAQGVGPEFKPQYRKKKISVNVFWNINCFQIDCKLADVNFFF